MSQSSAEEIVAKAELGKIKADILYFKPSGKWYSTAEDVEVRENYYAAGWSYHGQTVRQFLFGDGNAPGLHGQAEEFVIVIIPKESFPVMYPNSEDWT